MKTNELNQLNEAIETIKNYCKDLEDEKQFLIKPNKDIEVELSEIILVILKLSARRKIKADKYLSLLAKRYDKDSRIANCLIHDYLSLIHI